MDSKDKRHRFLVPTYNLNSAMPSAAGAPGLLLSCRKEMCDGLAWTLFIPVVEEKKARWIYAGEYIGETVGLLSPEDFRNHDQEVRNFQFLLSDLSPLILSVVIFSAKRSLGREDSKTPVYCALRARMTLRLGGSSDPTDLEVENEVARIKRNGYTSNLTGQDVIAAFERGDEVNLFFHCVPISNF